MFLHRIFEDMKHNNNNNNNAFLLWSNILSLTPCLHRILVQSDGNVADLQAVFLLWHCYC